MVQVPGVDSVEGLADRLHRIGSGGEVVAVVQGDPGTGRSHALTRIARTATIAGLRVASVRAVPTDHGLPYAVVDALGDELGVQLSSKAGTDPEDIATVAGRLVDAADGSADLPGTCLLVDDAGWADPESLRVLIRVAQRTRGRAIALVVALGPESLAGETAPLLNELRAADTADLVLLTALTPQETAAVAGSALTAEHAVVHERTAGNAFLVRALVDELLASDPGTADPSTVVPERVRAWVAARLHRLGPAASAFAQAVHVLGSRSTLARVTALAGLERRAAEDLADDLARVGLLLPGPELAFAQPVVNDAVALDLKPFQRDRLHRGAAAVLRDEHRPAEEIAVHLLNTSPAGEPWVVEVLRRAAETPSEAGDCAAAARLLRRALAEPPAADVRPQVLAELAFAESRAGLPGAPATLDQALEVAPSSADRLMLLRERTRLMWLSGRLPEAVDTSETALAETSSEHELHEVLLAEFLAVASMHDLAPIYARPRLVELLERARSGWIPDSPPLAATLATVLPFVLGDHRLVGPLVDRATEEDLWRVDAPPFGMRPDFVLGSLWLSGSLARGTAIIEQGMWDVPSENLLRHGLHWYWLGEIRYAAGDLRGSVEATRRAMEPRWGPFLSWFGFSAATRAHTFLDQGDARSAEKVLRAAETRVDPHHLDGISTDLARARLAIAQRRPDEGMRRLDLVRDRLDALGHRDSPQIVWRSLAAYAALRAGDRATGAQLLEEEIALGEATHAPLRIGRALRIQSELVEGAERLKILERSVEVLAASEYRLEQGRSQFALGLTLHDRGEILAARDQLAAAREIAEQSGCSPLAGMALNALHATGARPRRTARSGIDALTRTERQVVTLAASGKTNREIGELLDVSPRTVEWHLRGAFTKLGVSSRRDLVPALERAR